jgi:hypothetical protein
MRSVYVHRNGLGRSRDWHGARSDVGRLCGCHRKGASRGGAIACLSSGGPLSQCPRRALDRRGEPRFFTRWSGSGVERCGSRPGR